MEIYKIQKGDNLWKIVKSNYKTANGEELTNAQIANIVNQVAKDNNLENPNLIFADAKINLDAYDGFEVQKSSYDSDVEYYQQFEKAMLEGKNFNYAIDGDWTKGVQSLATGYIKTYDTDGNNKLSYEEFAAGEIKFLNATLGKGNEPVLDEDEATAMTKSFELIDYRNTGTPELEYMEVANFFKTLDNRRLQGDEKMLKTIGEFDGTIEAGVYNEVKTRAYTGGTLNKFKEEMTGEEN